MKTATQTQFEILVNHLHEAQAKAAKGYGTTLPYPSDALDGKDFESALEHARWLLQERQDQVERLSQWLGAVDRCVREGGKEEYIAEIERIYS